MLKPLEIVLPWHTDLEVLLAWAGTHLGRRHWDWDVHLEDIARDHHRRWQERYRLAVRDPQHHALVLLTWS